MANTKQQTTKATMHTNEFGFDIFIAPLENGNIAITDKIEEAQVWETEFDGSKLAYHSAVTGYNLQWMAV